MVSSQNVGQSHPPSALLTYALVAMVSCSLGWVCPKAGERVGPGREDQEGHPQSGSVLGRRSFPGESIRKGQLLGRGSFPGVRIIPRGEGHPKPQAAQRGDKQAQGSKSHPHLHSHQCPVSPCHADGGHSPRALPLPHRTLCRGPPAP